MTAKKTAGLSADAVVSSIITEDMFASDEIIEHPVKLGDGKERTMYFKPLSAIEWKQHMEAENSKDPKVRKEAAARLIARCVVEPTGKRALTPQQAARLKPAVSGAFFMAILEINEILKMPAGTPVTEGDDDIIDVELDDDDEDEIEESDSGN